MKKINLLYLLSFSMVLTLSTSCKKEGCMDALALNYDEKAEKDNGQCIFMPNSLELTGAITSDLTLKNTSKYILKGFVYVKEGVTLTIEAGTIIKGDKDSKGTLIVERGAKLIAEGTAEKPIVFTSNQPAGSRSYGDWGGIVLCGKATVNLPGGSGIIEGGTGATFGGTDDADNSGILKYVRIEFCGIAYQPNQEINGLTLGAVGSGTTIDYVQVSYSGDDSFEWFGGTVNCKHIIAHRGWDDDFDTDNGFSGKVQFAVALRDPAQADQSGSNGFESDNDGSGTGASPFTSVQFSNVTMVGPKSTSSASINSLYKRNAHIRRNTKIKIYNTLFIGYPDGILVDGSTTEANATNGDVQVKNSIIAGATNALKVNSGSTFGISTWFNDATKGNSILTNSSDVKLTDPFNLTSPNFLPASDSPSQGKASFSGLSGFESVSYIGAFGSENWTSTWANFNPQSTEY